MTTTFRIILLILLYLRLFSMLLLALGPIYLSKTLRRRKGFEHKNRRDSGCRSFSKDDLIADIAFEVSSEGELEQVRPLVMHYLQCGKRVELIFASESVEKKCLKLYCEYPEQLRIYRLPIISFHKTIRSWATASHLILCRYDFYPQLLLYAAVKGRKLSVVSGSLKNKQIEKGFSRWFYQNL